MKFRKLNFQIEGVITAIAIAIFTTACNNNDKSGKTATSTETKTDTSLADTSVNKTPANSAAKTASKKEVK